MKKRAGIGRKVALFAMAIAVGTAARAQVSRIRIDSLLYADTAFGTIGRMAAYDFPRLQLGEGGTATDRTDPLTPSLLGASGDPFLSGMYNLRLLHFRPRGLDASFGRTVVEGLVLDDPLGLINPGVLLAGARMVLQPTADNSLSQSQGDEPAFAARQGRSFEWLPFGGVKKTSATIASTEGQGLQFILTHASGPLRSGRWWAISVDGNKRGEVAGNGTFGRRFSTTAVLGKTGNTAHAWRYRSGLTLSLLTDAYALASATTSEMTGLAGSDQYNPDWGFQNGIKRNANVNRSVEALLASTHEWRYGGWAIRVAASGSAGEDRMSGLSWFQAPDPRPDYYRNLPSFIADPDQRAQLTTLLSTSEKDRQIRWDELYAVNRTSVQTIRNADGISGNVLTGYRAWYLVEDGISSGKSINASAAVLRDLGRLSVRAGCRFRYAAVRRYQVADDLLGADFYLDLNRFVTGNASDASASSQANLEQPLHIVRTGDRNGYDYRLTAEEFATWVGLLYEGAKAEISFSAQAGSFSLQREGFMQNGLFPEHSLGISPLSSFGEYTINSDFRWKLDGRNYLDCHLSESARAPDAGQMFISPTVRDLVQPEAGTQQVQSAEAGYSLRAPQVRAGISLYYISFSNGLQVFSFYHDGYNAFVHDALSRIATVHYGLELGGDVHLTERLDVALSVSVGRYYYRGNPWLQSIPDNSDAPVARQAVFADRLLVSGTPQQALSLTVRYRAEQFYFSAGLGAASDAWLSFSPERRTLPAIAGLAPGSGAWHAVIDQTRLPPAVALNASAGYSWAIKRRYRIMVFSRVENLADNLQIATGGYEQLRFDFDTGNPSRFPPKVYYAPPISIRLGLTIQHQ